jgi:ABC-2 type transport system permease protein
MREAVVLLRAKWRGLASYPRREDGGWRRLTILAALGVGFAAALYVGAAWFLGRVVEVEPIGEVMVRRLLGLIVLFVFGILSLSNLVAGFSTLYLAEDLPLVLARPVPAYALWTARWVENALASGWTTLCFSVPFFVAVGVVMDASPGYWLATAVAISALAAIAASVGLVGALLVGAVASARRARQVLVAVATVAFVVLFVLFRGLEPERFLDPDQRAPMLEVLAALRGSDPVWLPSSWALDAMWDGVAPGSRPAGHPLARLVSAGLATFFIGGWCFRAVHGRAFSRAFEGAGTGTPGGDGPRRPLAELVRARRERRGRPTPARALRAKDLRAFVRDPAQWGQLLLIAALVAIYVVNFKYIRSVGDTGIITATGLHFVNLALAGFVAVAVCARFSFPAVSLEGRAFWLLLRSPVPIAVFLRAKWSTSAVPLTLLVCTLVVLTNVWLGAAPVWTASALATAVPLTVGIAGLGLGLGACHPRFHTDNVAKIATGLGGILYMIAGTTVLVVVLILAAFPTLSLVRWIEHGQGPSGGRAVIDAATAAAAAALPIVAATVSLRAGRRRLERGV